MDPNNTLDLSKFTKIVPSSPEEIQSETLKRSAGINAIRDIMENLLNTMQSYLVDLQDMDGKARLMDQQKNELAEIDKQLRYSQTQLEAKEKGINDQLKFIEVQNRELIERDLALKAETESQKKEVTESKRELETKERDVDEKLTKVMALQKEVKGMEDKQVAIDQSIAIDRERKALLDAREEKILQREARLARLENDSKIG